MTKYACRFYHRQVMIGCMDAFLVAVMVISFTTLFGLSTINHTKQSKVNVKKKDDKFSPKNLTLDAIHFGGLIALGATLFSVGAHYG